MKNIAVIGTGYVGLVTGTCFAETGNNVVCVDIDANKVERMKNGEVPIYEPQLDVLFERNIKQNRFKAKLEKIARATNVGKLIAKIKRALLRTKCFKELWSSVL